MIIEIIFSLCFLFFLVIVSFIILHDIVPYLNKKNDIMEQKVKNEKYQLFLSIDSDNIIDRINDYFEGYVKRYMAYKFISAKKDYIKSEEIEKMVSDLTKVIAIDISELYVFYIKTIQNINTDEDMISFIHSQVKKITIDYVSNYNKPSDTI